MTGATGGTAGLSGSVAAGEFGATNIVMVQPCDGVAGAGAGAGLGAGAGEGLLGTTPGVFMVLIGLTSAMMV